jgi:type IV pilus assembly protein PilM
MTQVVGLDIGASAVRAAELDVGPGTPVLLRFGQVGLPPGVIVDGEIQDRTAVTEAVQRLWRSAQFESRATVVGLAGLRAITREVDLPWVPDGEVDSAVRFTSEEVIPFPPDKTILSTQVLNDFSGPDGAKMRRVLVAAAHRDLVEAVTGVVEAAGLQVAGVDLVSSALVRALVDPRRLSDLPEAVVSVGAGLTVVVVHQNGRPQFVRTVGTGGNAATAAIAAALDLPLADAELVKRRLGEPLPQVQAAERAVQASIEELVAEIRNSVQYFASLAGRPSPGCS